ncbi:ferredoxin-thioredoxin reductase catalytic domain-containing protein [Desulfopila inferna]|uniref:ferredoxin-thioredoxin reductase catalytic domain-containing protein n=1 Tax=Desulfopila inferna TaxID=468528 RepID=UPI0019660B5D|nr:ferredoxin-thioredoxin reductase catalytic domain-containing protein [Desulfopila inferna]MBM9603598.1 ferredoxin:thioredoxin reductase [Desulfopila inferna]
MTAEELYNKLKTVQEKRGLIFNKDRLRTLELLDGLLVNKERYGYLSCPCRVASGNLQHDRDIICPCLYCQPDIEEFGSCYCGLYVSREWNEGVIDPVYVPERRPPEKTVF